MTAGKSNLNPLDLFDVRSGLSDDERMVTEDRVLFTRPVSHTQAMHICLAGMCRGSSADYFPMRHRLNLESVFTYRGTETIHQLVLGKELTGVSACG
ncbi:MAG: hypothetical protein OEN22_09010 [Gammaproteobacteria bacterium]|nr:hypothetical protein [Gammaproteobacteria bacterium]